MRGIERIYNRYFNNTIDKVIVAIIVVYAVLTIQLSFCIIVGADSILKSIINTVSGNVGFYIPWVLAIMPVVRFSQIVNEKNILEGITAKSYKEKFIRMIKIYMVMYLLYLSVGIIHKVLIPIANNEFKNVEEMIFVFGNYIYTICFSIGMSMWCICSGIVKNLGKVNLKIGIFITGIVFFMNSGMFNMIDILTRGKEVNLYLITNLIGKTFIYFSVVIVYIIFIFAFMKFILKNINKVDTKRMWI